MGNDIHLPMDLISKHDTITLHKSIKLSNEFYTKSKTNRFDSAGVENKPMPYPQTTDI